MATPPIEGIRRINNRQTGIGFVLMPPLPMMSAHVTLIVVALFLKTPDNEPHSPVLLDLVMN